MSIQILLQDKINKIKSENPILENYDKDKLFEFAVVHFLNLKFLTGLDFEDLQDGIVGNGGDEGIDACYLFVNDMLIKEFDESTIKRSSNIRLEIVQAKNKSSFPTNGFDRTCQGVLEIFTLDKERFKFIGANESLLKKAQLIREVFRDAQTKGANFELRIHYATKGNVTGLPAKISHYKEKLNGELSWAFKEIIYKFLGAQELNELALRKEEKVSLEFIDAPLDLTESGTEIKGYAGFVRGMSLIKALLDENKKFKEELTEGNVRYFLGVDGEVNSAIIKTASSKDAENFWAMNNGITIIGDRIAPLAKNEKLIENPQIVNGCQTIHCLYEAYKQNDYALDPKLKVFVKVIEISNPDIQQSIIRATNTQNSVSIAGLMAANDNILKNIEEYLLKKSIYFERRKNFYKMKGRSGLAVISVEKMAQMVHTIFNKEAIRAVNDTKDLFRQDNLYVKIFSDSADLDAYLFAVKLYQKVWSMKNSDLRSTGYDAERKELMQRSLFCLLHICSSLLFGLADKIEISRFEKIRRDLSLFEKIDDDLYMKGIYKQASSLFLECADSYASSTSKGRSTLFKIRTFDAEYIVPAIKTYLKK